MSDPASEPPREEMPADVVIVGAGPAGLAAAIRLRQVAPELEVVVLEKGAEVGAHIVSGAIMDPVGLDALLPGWRDDPSAPAVTPVTDDRFRWLGPAGDIGIPHVVLPPLMSNRGMLAVSLANVCRFLAEKAAGLGVQVFPGFSGAELIHGEDGRVIGVATGDMGRARDGSRKPEFQRGLALLARYVLVAEGARGSLARGAIDRFGLDADAGPPKFGLGFKELWQVPPARARPGAVLHTFGWPLATGTGGGGFLYHLEGGNVSVGLVVHLDYANPNLDPFREFQRFKTHPAIREHLEGGTRIGYGARAITEGGLQSLPRLAFPGGLLVGCAAGMVSVPRIKGIHNAMRSGMLAAEQVAAAIAAGRAGDVLEGYDTAVRQGPIGRELRLGQNVKPLWSRLGTLGAVVGGGIDMWARTLLRLSPLGTLRHRRDDRALKPAASARPIACPPPDGVISFDRTSSVYLSATSHEEDQPSHLAVADPDLQVRSEHGVYGGPSARYCPAGVYEWVEEAAGPRFVVNAANCIHCKACDIKDPNGNITWRPPEGGGGPGYGAM